MQFDRVIFKIGLNGFAEVFVHIAIDKRNTAPQWQIQLAQRALLGLT